VPYNTSSITGLGGVINSFSIIIGEEDVGKVVSPSSGRPPNIREVIDDLWGDGRGFIDSPENAYKYLVI